MQQTIPEFEEVICRWIRQSYDFDVSSYAFLPVGDSAFSYIVDNPSHERRYLKVFDTSTQKGNWGVRHLHNYVPLMLELSESNLFRDLPKPFHTMSGDLWCSFDRFTCVLFEYIDGKTLADAYPFSDDVQTRIGSQLAKLHAVPFANLKSPMMKESYPIDFGERLHASLRSLQVYTGIDSFTLRLQSIVLPKLDLIHRFWKHFCEQQPKALHSSHEVVLCHGDLWGGNMMQQVDRRLVFLDWEGAIIAPIERDLFSYIGPEYTMFRRAYEQERQMTRSLNPDLVAFYAYGHQLKNLSQWLHNILNEDFGDEQKDNDLDMIGFHCLDRWPSIEESILELYED